MLKFGTPIIALPLAVKKCTVQTGCTVYTLRNLFSLTLAHAGLTCKVVLARAVPKDSTRALDFIIEMKPCPRPNAGTTLYLTTLSSQNCRCQ